MRGEDLVVLGEAGQGDHLRAIGCCPDLARGLDAVQPRHDQVHQHDVRSQGLRQPDALVAVAGLAHDRHVGLQLEEGAQALPHHLVIVHDQEADRGCSASGTGHLVRWSLRCTRSVVPAPGAEFERQPPADLGRALVHPRQADPRPPRLRVEPPSVVANLEFGRIARMQANPGLRGPECLTTLLNASRAMANRACSSAGVSATCARPRRPT